MAEMVNSKVALIKGASTEQLIDLWEMTEGIEGQQGAIIRGWIMDEIELRHPAEFNAWLDGDCEDSELRSYILGGRCSQHEEMSDDEIDREAERAIDEYEAEFGADGYRAFPGNREV